VRDRKFTRLRVAFAGACCKRIEKPTGVIWKGLRPKQRDALRLCPRWRKAEDRCLGQSGAAANSAYRDPHGIETVTKDQQESTSKTTKTSADRQIAFIKFYLRQLAPEHSFRNFATCAGEKLANVDARQILVQQPFLLNWSCACHYGVVLLRTTRPYARGKHCCRPCAHVSTDVSPCSRFWR